MVNFPKCLFNGGTGDANWISNPPFPLYNNSADISILFYPSYYPSYCLLVIISNGVHKSTFHVSPP